MYTYSQLKNLISYNLISKLKTKEKKIQDILLLFFSHFETGEKERDKASNLCKNKNCFLIILFSIIIFNIYIKEKKKQKKMNPPPIEIKN